MTDTPPDNVVDLSAPTVVDTPGGPAFAVPVDAQRGHLVPVEAVAAWGELLGLDDEAALAAILSRPTLPCQSADPDDNGWTALYDELTEVEATDVLVAGVERTYRLGVTAAEAERAGTADLVPAVPPQVRAAVDVYGADLVRAQTEATREDCQRTARAAIPTQSAPTACSALIQGLAPDLAARRAEFRAAHRPTI